MAQRWFYSLNPEIRGDWPALRNALLTIFPEEDVRENHPEASILAF